MRTSNGPVAIEEMDSKKSEWNRLTSDVQRSHSLIHYHVLEKNSYVRNIPDHQRLYPLRCHGCYRRVKLAEIVH